MCVLSISLHIRIVKNNRYNYCTNSTRFHYDSRAVDHASIPTSLITGFEEHYQVRSGKNTKKIKKLKKSSEPLAVEG